MKLSRSYSLNMPSKLEKKYSTASEMAVSITSSNQTLKTLILY